MERRIKVKKFDSDFFMFHVESNGYYIRYKDEIFCPKLGPKACYSLFHVKKHIKSKFKSRIINLYCIEHGELVIESPPVTFRGAILPHNSKYLSQDEIEKILKWK